MPEDFRSVFKVLRSVMAKHANQLSVKTDSETEFCVATKYPSPYKQHKGQPLFIGMVKVGKAYVSYHLMPIYMNPALQKQVTPALKKRMQGKACFNFSSVPDAALLADLAAITDLSVAAFATPPKL